MFLQNAPPARSIVCRRGRSRAVLQPPAAGFRQSGVINRTNSVDYEKEVRIPDSICLLAAESEWLDGWLAMLDVVLAGVTGGVLALLLSRPAKHDADSTPSEEEAPPEVIGPGKFGPKHSPSRWD